ncbi:hypothetical protein CYMTET_7289 [Cymbomonas tetramitiformis]|uniref:Uncharacterized protein n=1 Tax=Cymbomonas tetramitiformis TaxID=36881 RepID=A0AAE0LH12_9CHLO|nr:hypothetical protein CYMTET_7289 [Cymbomonas tetramitiformis]
MPLPPSPKSPPQAPILPPVPPVPSSSLVSLESPTDSTATGDSYSTMLTNDTILLIGVIASLTLTFFIGIWALNSFCKSSDINHESQAVELHGREQELPDDPTGRCYGKHHIYNAHPMNANQLFNNSNF